MTNEQILKTTKEALDQAIAQKKLSQEMLKNLGPAIIDILRPILEEMTNNAKISKEDIMAAVASIKVEVPKIDVPQTEVKVTIPEIKVPEPKVTVNVPDIKVPEIKIPVINVPKPEVTVNIPKFPDFPKFPEEMDIKGWVNLMGYDRGLLNNPLPVQLRDANGKPVNLLENLTTIIGGGGGGGKHDYFTIRGFSQSAFADYLNADGRLRVSVETGGSGLTDAELRASHLDVQQVSGSIDSVYVTGAFGSAVADGVFNSDNRLRVSVETGGSGLTDSELRASSIPVEQVSGSIWSTYVTGALNSILAGYENPDNRIKVELPTGSSGLTDTELRATAVPVSQVSGARWSTEATQGTSPWVMSATDLDIRDLANATDSISNYQVSGHRWSVEATQSGTWNITTVTGVTNSVAASFVDSSGVQYSGSNPVPVDLGTNNDVVEASASAIKTAVELIDNAIAGTEMQVDVVAALPTGTNAIGKLLQPDIDVTTNTNYAKKYYTSAGAVTDGIIWSPAAGKRWHIHTIYIQTSAAATVTLEDDLVAGDSAIWKAELAANSGVVLTFPEKYPWASSEDASDLIVTTNAGNIYISCSGFEV